MKRIYQGGTYVFFVSGLFLLIGLCFLVPGSYGQGDSSVNQEGTRGSVHPHVLDCPPGYPGILILKIMSNARQALIFIWYK